MTEETLFEAALNLPENQRLDFLRKECGSNLAFFNRMQELLQAHLKPELPLDQTVDSPPAGNELSTSIHVSSESKITVIDEKYQLKELIGEGGMGTVWLAKQISPLKRLVAIKLIKPGMDSRQVMLRFEGERQALAMMDHPNIAKVLDGGLHENRPYFVMELVKGVPITEYCDQRKLTPHQRLELFIQACQAIQHAHHKGIIHRDIKPSNVLVALYDDKPVVKVIDFGIAKATGSSLTEMTIETSFGGVVGTPQYMSPEQATFNNLDIDTRSDIYALGVLLYELLTGNPPFTDEELKRKGILEILRVVREEDPPLPSTRLSTADALPSISANRSTEPKKLTGILRSELDWIVMRALEKSRTRRYETANGFASDILRYLAGEPVQAHPPSKVYRLRKFIRKHRKPLLAASALFLTLFCGVLGTSFGLVQSIRATKRANLARQESVTQALIAAENERVAVLEADRADRNAAQMRHHLNLFRLKDAQSGYRAGNIRYARETLLDVEPEYRSVAWGITKRQLEGSDITFFGHTDKVNCVAWSPDDCYIATASDDCTVCVWELATGNLVHRFADHNYLVLTVSWSSDGKQLASAGADGRIIIWNLLNGGVLKSWNAHSDWVNSLEFSPDCKLLSSSSSDRSIAIWDCETGKIVKRFNDFPYAMHRATWNKDGSLLAAYGFFEKQISVYSTTDWSKKSTITSDSDELTAISWHPDGRHVGALIAWSNSIAVWNAISSKKTESINLPGLSRASVALTWHTDGKSFACVSNDIDIIVMMDNEWREPLRGHETGINNLTWSNSGKYLASVSADLSIRIWNPRHGQFAVTLDHDDALISSCCWSPNGKMIASCSNNKTEQVRIFDSATGKTLHTLSGHEESVTAVAWSPDGKRLLCVGWNHKIDIWDCDSWKKITTIASNLDHGIDSIAWAPNGKMFANNCGNYLEIRDSTTLQVLHQLRCGEQNLVEIAWSPDSTAISVGDFDGKVIIWDAGSGKELIAKQCHFEYLRGLCWSPDGKYLATNSVDFPEVVIRDPNTLNPVLTLRGDFTAPHALDWSPDGRTLASVGPEQVIIWDTKTWTRVYELWDNRPRGVVKWSPQGNRLLLGNLHDIAVILEPNDTPLPVRLKNHHDRINAVVLSPDSKLLATAGNDRRIVIWDTDSRTVVREIPAHSDAIHALAWSPDSRKLASGGMDTSVRIWDVSTGKKLHDFLKHENIIVHLIWSKDGNRLWSQSYSPESYLWDVSTGKMLQENLKHLPDKFIQNINPQDFYFIPDGADIVIHPKKLPESELLRRKRIYTPHEIAPTKPPR
ncbi:MAG: protein kinase [Zavarzinella sp.]